MDLSAQDQALGPRRGGVLHEEASRVRIDTDRPDDLIGHGGPDEPHEPTVRELPVEPVGRVEAPVAQGRSGPEPPEERVEQKRWSTAARRASRLVIP
jgi:hypothetical protein